MDLGDARRKPNFAGKVAVAVALTVMCILVLKQSPGFGGTSVVCPNSLPHQLAYVTVTC
jgi:UDP-arabinose 4-epimerase